MSMLLMFINVYIRLETQILCKPLCISVCGLRLRMIT